MKLENVVPWGRNLDEYKKMFLLSTKDLESKILGCGDGPSSFNYELTQLNGNITSIDPIYEFTKEEITQRIDETSQTIREQLTTNQNDFIWKDIKDVDELVTMRLKAMNEFLNDYDKGKKEKRYVNEILPDLSFPANSFDLVLCSHFLFLYSDNFDLGFHINSIFKMCQIAKKEVRIFPIVDLENKRSHHLEWVMRALDKKGFKSEIVKTTYEFQKGGNEMLRIKIL